VRASGLQRLRAEDRAILDLESRTIAGHTCKVIVLEPGRGDSARLELLRRRIAGRLQNAPRMRQRLVATPLRVAAPVWVDDPRFDVANHVLPLVGQGPIDARDLPELVASLMRGRLDRSRPLWSLHVAELNDGGAALVWRIHHCMADGTAALRLGAQLLWDSEQDTADSIAPADWNPRPIPGRWQLFVAGARDRLRSLAHSRPPVLRAPVKGGPKRVIATIRRELSPGKNRSPFDAQRLSAERAVAFASASLSELKQIGREVGDGVTVNDVLLALIAGGLRYWMIAEGRESTALRARIPVSLHHHDQLANRDSFFSVELPLWEPDPASRLGLIHDAAAFRKSHHDAQALDAVFGGRSRVPIPMERFLARRADDPRVGALCVSNVPGPRAPIFVAGARARELYSVAEIGERHALRVSAISLAGILSVGFCAEPTAVPHLGIMVEGVSRELQSLRAIVGTGAVSGGR
jgi:diacylglycerol O-acyltransferase / wax synthase